MPDLSLAIWQNSNTIGQSLGVRAMPSKSAKQARFMAACSHGAGYKSCPPGKVAKEFNAADKKAGTLRKKRGKQ
jgi:hypothetical protein